MGTPVIDSDLAAWATHLQRQQLAATSIKGYVGNVERCARWSGKPARDLTADDIAAWLEHRPYAAWTKVRYLESLRQWGRWCAKTGRAPKGMTKGLRKPRTPGPDPDPITLDQWRALLAHVRDDDRMTAAVLLGGLAGLRIHEIAKFRGGDLDPWRKTLTVVGKGGKPARLPADDRLVRHARRMPPGLWFPNARDAGRPRPSTTLGWALSCTMRAAGIEGGHPHQLRAFLATQLNAAGVPLPEIARMLRHSQVATTMYYVAADEAALRAALPRVAA